MDFKWATLVELFKEKVPSLLNSAKNLLLAPISGFLSLFGLDKVIDDGTKSLTSTVLKSTNPNLPVATDAIEKNFTVETITPLVTSKRLPQSVAKELHEIYTTGSAEFFTDGIPSLDRYGKPTAAIDKGQKIEASARKLLLGGDGDIGAIAAHINTITTDPVEREKLANDPSAREKIANEILAPLSGVSANQDLTALTTNIDSIGGFTKMLIAAQLKNANKGKLAEADMTFALAAAPEATLNAQAAAADAVAANKPTVSAGTDVQTHQAPPAGPKKQPVLAI